MAGGTPGTDYGSWSAEQVVNNLVVPDTQVPDRSGLVNANWISSVGVHTNPDNMGNYDYIFGFRQPPSLIVTFVGLTLNTQVRGGGNGTGGPSNTGDANAFFNGFSNALQRYSNGPGATAIDYQYPLGAHGGGSDPNTMSQAGQAIQGFYDWLEGTNGGAGAGPLLTRWVNWLGSEDASWQGSAAETVYQIITQIGRVMTDWQTKIAGPGNVSMPATLGDSAWSLAANGNALHTKYLDWVATNTVTDSTGSTIEQYTPEGTIRKALTDHGLLTGGMGGESTVWDKNFPDKRSGYFVYQDPNTDIVAGGWTANQVYSYLTQSTDPGQGMQAEAKNNFTTTLGNLDTSFGTSLQALAGSYSTSNGILVPVGVVGLTPPSVTPVDPKADPNADPNGKNKVDDPTKQPADGPGQVGGAGAGGTDTGAAGAGGLGGGTTPVPNSALNADTSGLPGPDGTGAPSLTDVGNPSGAGLDAPPGVGTGTGLGAGTADLNTPTPLSDVPVPGDPMYIPPVLGGGSGRGFGAAPEPLTGSKSPGGKYSDLGLTEEPENLDGLADVNKPGYLSGPGSLRQSISPAKGASGLPESLPDNASEGEGSGNGVPLYPPTGAGMGGAGQNGENKDRERTTWIAEDEAVWGADPELPPAVFGR